MSMRIFFKDFLASLSGDRARWRKVSELAAADGAGAAEIAVLAEEGGVAWDEIVSIRHVGREPVFDVEIEDTHNFVGNGIYAHNTYASTTPLLTVHGQMAAEDGFAVPNAPVSFVLNGATTTPAVPSSVLTTTGAIDVSKLALYNLANAGKQQDEIQQLSLKVDALASSTSSTTAGTYDLVSMLGQIGSSFVDSVLHVTKLAADTFYAANLFVDHLTAANATVGSSAAPTGVTLYDQVTKQPYCLRIENGVATSTPGACADVSTSVNPFATTTTTSSGPLSVALIGANPTHLLVGSTYVEQGATVSGGSGDGAYLIYVNGSMTATSSPWIDTSAPATYILTYSAVDSAGHTATVTRSVIVGNPDGTVSTSSTSTSSTSTSGTTSSTSSTTSTATTTTTAPTSTATSTTTTTSTSSASTTATTTATSTTP